MTVTFNSADKVGAHIEAHIEAALSALDQTGTPPRLMAAMRYAVQPGGARIRPRLCLAVFQACGGNSLDAALASATAIEMMHCASLVHDDMPLFDDAQTRRGKPALHLAFDESLALLTGDALIVEAFEVLSRGLQKDPSLAPQMMSCLAKCVGMPHGLCAGQAWEGEPHPDLEAYHAAKTGALFAGVAVLGALAAGHTETKSWDAFGRALGGSYQVADDIRDVVASAEVLGKPSGQDQRLGRPNIALMRGVPVAVRTLVDQVEDALDHIPDCAGRDDLIALVRKTVRAFLPADIWALAA